MFPWCAIVSKSLPVSSSKYMTELLRLLMNISIILGTLKNIADSFSSDKQNNITAKVRFQFSIFLCLSCVLVLLLNNKFQLRKL